MTKRGGYQATAAGAFGAGEAAPEAEGPEAQLAEVIGKAERRNAIGIMVDTDLLRALLATVTALRAELVDARRLALEEAAKVLERRAASYYTQGKMWDEVTELAALLRVRAATPAPPAPDRESLGRLVREAWTTYCRETGDLKPSHVAPWEDLSEWDREADRRIGDALRAAISATPAPPAPDPRDARIAALEHVARRFEEDQWERFSVWRCPSCDELICSNVPHRDDCTLAATPAPPATEPDSGIGYVYPCFRKPAPPAPDPRDALLEAVQQGYGGWRTVSVRDLNKIMAENDALLGRVAALEAALDYIQCGAICADLARDGSPEAWAENGRRCEAVRAVREGRAGLAAAPQADGSEETGT